MTINDAIPLLTYVVTIVAPLSAAAGYCIGRLHGFGLGKEQRPDSGWEDEALWWRKNSTGIVGAPYVREDEGTTT